MAYVDYMDIAVCCLRQVIKFTHSLTHTDITSSLAEPQQAKPTGFKLILLNTKHGM